MAKIAVFVGSLQTKSYNKMLAKDLIEVAPDELEFEYIDINLPLLNQDLEVDFPAEVTAVKTAVKAADGVLFVTPEYNHNIPGVLKNALDWVTRPSGDNSFASKPAGIVGASPSQTGTRNVQPLLRGLLTYLQMDVMESPEIYIAEAGKYFDDDGTVGEELKQDFMNYMQAFTDWVHTTE